MLLVLKVGPRGSYVSHAGLTIAIKSMGDGKALDTTGAGDSGPPVFCMDSSKATHLKNVAGWVPPVVMRCVRSSALIYRKKDGRG